MAVKILREITDPQYGNHFIIEKEYDERRGVFRHTYCQMEEVYDNNKNKLAFNPGTFKFFDGHVTDYLNDYPGYLGGIYEKGSRHYAEFEAVRVNIAMVRMCVYDKIFPDNFLFKDAIDKTQKEIMLKEMGTCIGATLKHESRIRFFTNLFNFRDMPKAEKRFGDFGVEHIGAAKMYKRLLRKQNAFTLNPLRWLKGKFNSYDWNLPPIEETILCQQDIHEAIFTDSHKKDIGVQTPASHLAAEAKLIFETCLNVGNDAMRSNVHRRPQALSDESAEESVILAHRIIDNWKHINASTDKRSIDEIDVKDRELEKGELLAELTMTYDKIMADVSARYPELLANDSSGVFSQAKLAMGKLGYLTLLRAIEACPAQNDGNLQHELLYIEEKKIPDVYKLVSPREEQALIMKIEQALLAAEQHRALRQARSAAQQGVPLSKEASLKLHANLTHSISEMHHKISHTSVHIGAASSWAIPAAQAINAEKQVAMEQKQMHSQPQTSSAPARQTPDQEKQLALEQERLSGQKKGATVQL